MQLRKVIELSQGELFAIVSAMNGQQPRTQAHKDIGDKLKRRWNRSTIPIAYLRYYAVKNRFNLELPETEQGSSKFAVSYETDKDGDTKLSIETGIPWIPPYQAIITKSLWTQSRLQDIMSMVFRQYADYLLEVEEPEIIEE